MQEPRKRIKSENILTDSLVTILAHTCIASLTDYSNRKVAKIIVRCTRVPVRAKGYVSQQSSPPEKMKGKFFHEWKCPRGLLAWL